MDFEIRYAVSPNEFKRYTTSETRRDFLIEGLFKKGVKLAYSYCDRIIAGSVTPDAAGQRLEAAAEMRCAYFLERREAGIINVGGAGTVTADGRRFDMQKYDCLYLGRGTEEVYFKSADEKNPAAFWLNSCPAHAAYPAAFAPLGKAASVKLGSAETSNARTIYKFIHPQGIQSCQLVMGLTMLEKGSVWNTMPCHTHERRMEVYFYFDIAPSQVVFHMFGKSDETRHIVLQNEQSVISPSWSIHSGVGTASYSFIWAMARENQTFDDMDNVVTTQLR